jgi:hypothetical protein
MSNHSYFGLTRRQQKGPLRATTKTRHGSGPPSDIDRYADETDVKVNEPLPVSLGLTARSSDCFFWAPRPCTARARNCDTVRDAFSASRDALRRRFGGDTGVYYDRGRGGARRSARRSPGRHRFRKGCRIFSWWGCRPGRSRKPANGCARRSRTAGWCIRCAASRVNLAPAELPKQGPSYDLPLACPSSSPHDHRRGWR